MMKIQSVTLSLGRGMLSAWEGDDLRRWSRANPALGRAPRPARFPEQFERRPPTVAHP